VIVNMRTYGDGCSSAHALDLVGERWALLIVRDLLFGPKRFTDLHAGLPQGSPNVLTQRLRELEDSGIVRRRKLPPPASAMVYELTEWGAELEPILMGLQRWGAASPSYPLEVPVGCDAAMLSVKNAFDPAAAAGLSADVEVEFDIGAYFRVAVRDGTIDIVRGPAEHPDATIYTDPATLEQLVIGLLPPAAAERSGALRIEGDRQVIERLLGLFPEPADSGQAGT
jgi:DNA-binding HxlR family transcriptional regulator/putative sterol carrier protein